MAKTLTVALMDPPYETETTTTAFRIIDAALRQGHHVNVSPTRARST
jgi:tRNA 2-thiouridine synthesizing protein D